MDGEALSTLRKNRIGFCILHPMACAGLPCTISHVDGSVERGAFPTYISPHQPFVEFDAITHEMPGLTAELRLSGDTFEMEDQRNWTDASFKTYSTPLRLPFRRGGRRDAHQPGGRPLAARRRARHGRVGGRGRYARRDDRSLGGTCAAAPWAGHGQPRGIAERARGCAPASAAPGASARRPRPDWSCVWRNIAAGSAAEPGDRRTTGDGALRLRRRRARASGPGRRAAPSRAAGSALADLSSE